MNHESVLLLLDEYVDGTLSSNEMQEVRQHLQSCAECSEELARLRSLLSQASALPKSTEPGRDLWEGISERIQLEPSNVIPLTPRFHGREGRHDSLFDPRTSDARSFAPTRWKYWMKQTVSIAAAVVVSVGSFLLVLRSPGRSWEVASLQGNPTIDSEQIDHKGRLGLGEWLETDSQSRAEVTVANIGHVELGPNSRLRLLDTRANEHRLELARGQMHAKVWSPPRIFIVETPSATAVDLGCSYDLIVDASGSGTLLVLTGEVSLEFKGRDSYVPAGALCETRPGFGPGTPYSDQSSEDFRQSLRGFDFEQKGEEALNAILKKVQETDAITLWHLLSRVDEQSRERVYDRLAGFVKPPRGVTKEGVMKLDKTMLEEWLDEFSTHYSFSSLFSGD